MYSVSERGSTVIVAWEPGDNEDRTVGALLLR